MDMNYRVNSGDRTIKTWDAEGKTSIISVDPASPEYTKWLEGAERTHESVLAQIAARERDPRIARIRSARAKLIALGLTRQEFRALFDDPDSD